MGSFMICIPHHILSSDQTMKNEMGGACGMCTATNIGTSVFS